MSINDMIAAHKEMQFAVCQCLIDASNERRDMFTRSNLARILTDIANVLRDQSGMPKELSIKVSVTFSE